MLAFFVPWALMVALLFWISRSYGKAGTDERSRRDERD